MADTAAASGGGGSVIGAIASVANNVISNLFNAKAQKRELALKEQEQNFQHSLSALSNEQQYVLSTKLNEAKNDTERYAILTDAVTKIKLQGLQNSTSSNTQKTMMLLGVMVMAVVILVVLKRK